MMNHYSRKYLLGCVWFETLFNESVVENSFIPEAVDPAYASFLRKTSHAVTTGQLDTVQ